MPHRHFTYLHQFSSKHHGFTCHFTTPDQPRSVSPDGNREALQHLPGIRSDEVQSQDPLGAGPFADGLYVAGGGVAARDDVLQGTVERVVHLGEVERAESGEIMKNFT